MSVFNIFSFLKEKRYCKLNIQGYNYPRHRDPAVPWVLMTYESANSVRERAANWGRYPALRPGPHIDNVFNRWARVGGELVT